MYIQLLPRLKANEAYNPLTVDSKRTSSQTIVGHMHTGAWAIHTHVQSKGIKKQAPQQVHKQPTSPHQQTVCGIKLYIEWRSGAYQSRSSLQVLVNKHMLYTTSQLKANDGLL
jgi:hypothetical protein